MVKSFVFLVVFISTHCLIQGIDEHFVASNDVSKLLLDISNLLAVGDPAKTASTATQSTTATTVEATTGSLSTTEHYNQTTEHPSTTGSSTENPSTTVSASETTPIASTTTSIAATTAPIASTTTPIASTTTPIASTTTPSTENPSTTASASTTTPIASTTPPIASTTPSASRIAYSSEVRDSPPAVIAIVVDPSPVIESSTKVESLAATVAPVKVLPPPSIITIIVEPLPVTESSTKAVHVPTTSHSLSNASKTAIPINKIPADTSTKISSCPENCYLDITGVYCHCYQPTEKAPLPKVVF